jgi:protein-S-isoprenylcysteine O-methyltransferase Ste14
MKAKEGEHPWGDVGQLVLLVGFLVVWIVDSFVLRLSTGLSRFIPLAARLALAAILFAGSLLLVRAGHAAVGHGGGPSGLIVTGAFRRVRHPLYLGSALFYLGFAVSTASLLSLLAWLVIALFYDYIAGYEERLLEARFGDEYRAYRSDVGKWIPRRPGRGRECR